MHELTCQRCGHGWEYSGESEHYCTCPNCKTSVKVGGSERATPEGLPEASDEASPTAERGTTSDRMAGTVAVEAGGHEEREMPMVEAVEALDEAVTELYELQTAQGETVSELAQGVEEQSDDVADLRDGLEELAGYFAELVEEAGGEVDYDHVDPGKAVPEALKDVDVDGVYDPTEEFDG